MKILVAGLGRIGRHIIRELCDTKAEIEFDIYDLNQDLANHIYLLNYDSIYGLRSQRFKLSSKSIIDTLSKKEICFVDMQSRNFDFSAYDYVIDSTGSLDFLENAKKTAKRVYITNSLKNSIVDKYSISNVGENKANNNDKVVSLSICDTTAIAPILVSLENEFKIIQGHITTLHPWLNYQNLSDNGVESTEVKSTYIGDYSLGRKTTENLIPKNTSAVSAMSFVFPEISKKITSWSFRVPTPIVSTALLNIQLGSETDKDQIIDLFSAKSFIDIGNENLISSDYVGVKKSCVIDAASIKVLNKTVFFNLWYDNELGYVSQILNLIDELEA